MNELSEKLKKEYREGYMQKAWLWLIIPLAVVSGALICAVSFSVYLWMKYAHG